MPQGSYVDSLETIRLLLASKTNITARVGDRIFHGILPPSITDLWHTRQDVLPTIYLDLDEDEISADPVSEVGFTITIFAKNHSIGQAIAEIIHEELDQEVAIEINNQVIICIYQDGVARNSEIDQFDWPIVEISWKAMIA